MAMMQNVRPAYVSFETKVVEKQHPRPPEGTGLPYYEEVDFANVTPQGTKDLIPREVSAWFSYLQLQVDQEMMPIEVLNKYKAQYEAWKKKEEIPLEGTPIKGWPLATIGQQDACLRANIRTVEDLANCSSEAIQRIGMGAQELRNRAGKFLEAQNSTAPLAARMASLEASLSEVLAVNKKLAEENGILKANQGVTVAEKQNIPGITPPSPPAPSKDVTLGIDDTQRSDPQLVDKLMDEDFQIS